MNKRGPNFQSAEAVATIKKLKEEGKSYAEIGNMLGFSRQRAQRLIRQNVENYGRCTRCNQFSEMLHRHHVSYKVEETELLCQRCHRITHCEGEAREIIDRLEDILKTPRLTIKEISERSELSPWVVRKYIKLFAYEVMSFCALRNVTNWNRPQREIALECGVVQAAVSQFMRRNGIKRIKRSK